jgi:hypothetical protein
MQSRRLPLSPATDSVTVSFFDRRGAGNLGYPASRTRAPQDPEDADEHDEHANHA